MDLTQHECCVLSYGQRHTSLALSASPTPSMSCCCQNYKPAVLLISNVQTLCIYQGSKSYHCHRPRISSMGLLQAPLLPTPHSKWAVLTLLLPAPLHIFLVAVPMQEDVNHPIWLPASVWLPEAGAGLAVCHRPCLWFCSSGIAGSLSGELGHHLGQPPLGSNPDFNKKQISQY